MRVLGVISATFWVLCMINISGSVSGLPGPAHISHRKQYRAPGPIDSHGRPFVDRGINFRDEKLQNIPEDQIGRASFDVVKKFTRPVKSRVVVSSAAAFTLTTMVYILSTSLLSSAPAVLLWLAALSGGGGVFLNGDFGEFCRALGVFSILLVRRTSFSRFLVKFVSQSKATLGLTGRRPFPPGGNPWRYAPEPGATDLEFRMTSALLVVLLCAAYAGWLLARWIPLLPNWLGALGSAATVGYAATLPDGRGDLLRYAGFCLVSSFTIATDTMDDVMLKEKLSALLGHMLFFSKAVDDKYHVLSRLQFLLAAIISRITLIIRRIRRDINGESRRELRREADYDAGGYDDDPGYAAGARDARDGGPHTRRYGSAGSFSGGS